LLLPKPRLGQEHEVEFSSFLQLNEVIRVCFVSPVNVYVVVSKCTSNMGMVEPIFGDESFILWRRLI
jgi:hypothetical protein